LRLGGPNGFQCPADFQPWSHDSRALLFLTWDESPLHIYEVAPKSMRHVSCASGFIYSAQWSPGADRLLVTSATAALLIDQAGMLRGAARWVLDAFDEPYAHWTKDGKWFFVVARESATARTVLTFYDGEDGTLCEAHELDPIDLVPYEAEQFTDLPARPFLPGCLTFEWLGGTPARYVARRAVRSAVGYAVPCRLQTGIRGL
jgi:hypothetical protein